MIEVVHICIVGIIVVINIRYVICCVHYIYIVDVIVGVEICYVRLHGRFGAFENFEAAVELTRLRRILLHRVVKKWVEGGRDLGVFERALGSVIEWRTGDKSVVSTIVGGRHLIKGSRGRGRSSGRSKGGMGPISRHGRRG